MAIYSYEITSKGATQKGRIYADNVEEAALQVKKPGWYIVNLKEEVIGQSRFLFIGFKSAFPSYDKINFTDHLSSAIGAGTPLQDALDAYVEEGDRKSEIIDTISKDVQRGRKLSDAMSKHPRIFSPLYTALVEAGEVSGSLDETLAYMANELRREHEFVSKVKSAMFYPIIVLTVSLIVVSLVIGLVVPKIVAITQNFGGDLPTITKIVVAISRFLNSYSWLIGLFILGLIATIAYLLKDAKSKSELKAKLITFPLVGQIMRQFILARFLRIVGSCIKYGIQLPKALELSGGIVDNLRYKAACENINKKITHGQNLSAAFAAEDKLLFPPIISRTIKGGEKTGKVDIGLLRLSSYYEAEVDRNLKRLTELIEPAMIIILGVFVALIAISVIAPIYQMTSRIK
jgi:type II secretory pathway component PulF